MADHRLGEAEATAIATLADPIAWSVGAGALLADLGFTLIHSDQPGAPGGSHLLVALRAEPTLHHFDPESISYWERGEPHSRRVTFTRHDLRPGSRIALWGHVHLVDRLGVENRYLTFGGEVRASSPDPTTTLIDLASPGPIVRWGGHSQATDALAEEVGAFFGRLILPVDYAPGAEARIAIAPPEGLYAAFLIDVGQRLHRIARRGGPPNPLSGWIGAEARRLATARASSWTEGQALLAALGSETAP